MATKTWWCCGVTALLFCAMIAGGRLASQEPKSADEGLDWQLPDERLKLPWKDQLPLVFVNRNQNFQEWKLLKAFWNPATAKASDPISGQQVEIPVIKIKVPLGLSQNPPVPLENPMTYLRWELGRKLFHDPILSSDGTVSCASCHDPARGFTDQARVSTGIGKLKGGVSAPTVVNAAYFPLQFWDGRALSLEDQAQGPVGNSLEMFAGKGHAWNDAVKRVRANSQFVDGFKKAFGTLPTRDAIAKAIATYERTVLVGNAIYDRAEVAMRARVAEDGGNKYEIGAADFEAVLTEAKANKDANALKALKLDAEKVDAAELTKMASSLSSGRSLFFGKARCSLCHIGDNFSDGNFHNLGVGVKDGKIPPGGTGRFAILPTGHKNAEFYGAFKTPPLRHLLSTAPYMHDGGEATLEAVVDFYDRGGNANEYLSTKMRDPDAEKQYLSSKASGAEYKGPTAYEFNGRVVVPMQLKLTAQEKADLVLFLRALQSDPVDPLVADPAVKAALR